MMIVDSVACPMIRTVKRKLAGLTRKHRSIYGKDHYEVDRGTDPDYLGPEL